MKIALIGYGKMGKAIERIAQDRGHEVALTVDKENQQDFTKDRFQKIDVAIEFSTPATALANYMRCFEFGVPVVSGTTGWLGEQSKVQEKCKNDGARFFYASNFSLGVNLFFQINKYVARLMSMYSDYRCEVEEIHHTQKLDAPSGTAITIAEGVIENSPNLNKWQNSVTNDLKTLPIESKRVSDVPGTHIVRYNSSQDVLSIAHEAKGREGFALGAVLAGEFLAKQSEGWYGMEDLLKINK